MINLKAAFTTLIWVLTYNWALLARVFVLGRLFQPRYGQEPTLEWST